MVDFLEGNKKLSHEILKNSRSLIYKNYKAGEIVEHNGASMTKTGIILDGLLQIVNYTYSGEKKSHEYLEKNTLIPIYHLSGVKVYKYTLVCEKDAKVAWINIDEFELILKKDPGMLYDMLVYVSKRGYKAQLQLGCMKYTKVRERLAYWIVEFNQIEDRGYIKLPQTQTIFADSLYVNRSSLNQELKKFIDEGLIEVNGKTLKILDIEKLKENY